MTLSIENQAKKTLSTQQKIGIVVLLIASVVLLYLNYFWYLVAFVGIAIVAYNVVSVVKLYLLYRLERSQFRGLQFKDTEIQSLVPSELPMYTILVPLYKEAEIISNLVESLILMDYPREKLEVLLLLEEDDAETLAAIEGLSLPSYFHKVIVPDTYPKTKPKACNVGLERARGKYLVIYDAEDRPEKDQLKKAVLAFIHSEEEKQDFVCFQAKLNFYNPRQNLLTKLFTIEYSFWFELMLPSLYVLHAPMPLGGTSNHFRTEILKSIGGWNPYIVTEDCDLGIRLKRAGYEVGIIDSITLEEANSRIGNWLRQRSRWIKGYIQTYFLHLRHPLKLLKDLGLFSFIHFHIMVGAGPILCLINPIFWGMFWFQLATGSDFIDRLFPGVIMYLGTVSLLVWNFAFIYFNIYAALVRKDFDLVKVCFLSPISWGLMSLAAIKAFVQLFKKPHYWEKTQHGLLD
ncbi:glycosyltransferase [Candidatus Poribacteria bacterium]|nr:glycosyltransferase [Candidatus Poribacteria bacterium]